MKAFERELKQYLQFVKLEKGLSENSVVSYQNDLERYLDFIAKELNIRDLGGITHSHIEQFLELLTDMGLAVSTISRLQHPKFS